MSRTFRTALASVALGALSLTSLPSHAALSTVVNAITAGSIYSVNITVPAGAGPLSFSAYAKSGSSFGAISLFTLSGTSVTPAFTGNLATLSLPTGLAAGTYTLSVGSNSFAAPTYTVKTTLASSAYSVTQVPEPETMAMGLAGLGVVGFLMARRRRA